MTSGSHAPSLSPSPSSPSTRRKRLGLALGGGVARGLAHVGVIEALEKAGIEADFVSGVSAGSIVGAVYAAGADSVGLKRLARELNWLQLARLSFLNPFRRGLARLGLLDFYNLELLIVRTIGDLTFEELPRRLVIGSSDLLTGESVTLTRGRVAAAVRASCSLPGVVIPARRGGRLLCDGFISNNLHIEALRELGAEVVLAVNLMPRPRRLPSGFFWAGSGAVSSLILRAGEPLDAADLLVEPDLAEASYIKFAPDDLIERGRAAAAPLIPQLKALLG